MGFSDLEQGWHHEIFDLVDVTIHRSVELQEKDDDGGWIDRLASFPESDEAFGNVEELRYSEPQGTLAGKARFANYMDEMVLGVPEDKIDSGVQTRIASVDVQIGTVPDDEIAERAKKGRIQCFEAYEHMDKCVNICLYISSERFDEICSAAAEPDVTFQIGINIKGWHWLGSDGESKIFFKADGYDLAELASITVSRKIPNPAQ